MAGVIDIANTNTCELYSYVVDFIQLVNTTIRKCVIMFENYMCSTLTLMQICVSLCVKYMKITKNTKTVMCIVFAVIYMKITKMKL